MKFIIQKDQLVELIGKIQGVASSRPVIPILANVLIEARDRKVILTTTDLTVSMRVFCEADILEEGGLALPAKRLFQLVRELTTPQITLETIEEGIAVLTAGSSQFRLHGMNKEEFPTYPDLKEGKSFSILAETLRNMLVNTSFAAARDDTRQVLNGVYLEIEHGKATLVGTDGKRLAKIEEPISFDEGEKLTSIIPLKAVEEMARLLEDENSVTVTLMRDKIALETDRASLISKLLSGQFPDYQRVIPNPEGMNKISIHREELMTLLKQVSLFTSEISHSVRLTFDHGELKLQATNNDIGEGRVHMPVDYSQDRLDIAFNPHYFLDILRHCKDETVNFGITDSFNPGSITTDSSTAHYVLMPMRLANE